MELQWLNNNIIQTVKNQASIIHSIS